MRYYVSAEDEDLAARYVDRLERAGHDTVDAHVLQEGTPVEPRRSGHRVGIVRIDSLAPDWREVLSGRRREVLRVRPTGTDSAPTGAGPGDGLRTGGVSALRVGGDADPAGTESRPVSARRPASPSAPSGAS